MRFLKLILATTLVIFLANGCKDNSSLIQHIESIEKAELIEIPSAKNGMGVESLFTYSKEIFGENGGKIEFSKSFPGLLGTITVKGKLEVPKNAYSGKKTIVVQVSDEAAYVDLGPSPTQFNIPLDFDIEYKNLSLFGLVLNGIDFVYVTPDNYSVPCSYESIYLNIYNGELKVKGAKLHHFSRYGFTKRQQNQN